MNQITSVGYLGKFLFGPKLDQKFPNWPENGSFPFFLRNGLVFFFCFFFCMKLENYKWLQGDLAGFFRKIPVWPKNAQNGYLCTYKICRQVYVSIFRFRQSPLKFGSYCVCYFSLQISFTEEGIYMKNSIWLSINHNTPIR